MVEGLALRFRQGVCVDVQADRGADVVRGEMAVDDGAKRVGEVALVDAASRIGQLGRPSTRRCSTRTRAATSPTARASPTRSPGALEMSSEEKLAHGFNVSPGATAT